MLLVSSYLSQGCFNNVRLGCIGDKATLPVTGWLNDVIQTPESLKIGRSV